MMKDRFQELIDRRPEFQFSHDDAKSKVEAVFENRSGFAIGMGLGKKLSSMPAMKTLKPGFAHSRFLRQRMGV